MTALALCGGFGNVLFQLNLFYAYRHLFEYVTCECGLIRAFRKARGLNCPSQLDYIHILNLFDLCNGPSQSATDYLLLGLSNILHRPVVGRYWSNYIDPELLDSSTIILKTYAQYQVPIQEEFLSLLRTRLLVPRSHLVTVSSQYDALVHVRCGDLSRTAGIVSYYRKAMSIYSNILIVTDDSIQASRFFPSIDPALIISSDSYLDDFALLAFAKNIISSNSTFAWWASELSAAESVIEPFEHRLGLHFDPVSSRSRLKL